MWMLQVRLARPLISNTLLCSKNLFSFQVSGLVLVWAWFLRSSVFPLPWLLLLQSSQLLPQLVHNLLEQSLYGASVANRYKCIRVWPLHDTCSPDRRPWWQATSPQAAADDSSLASIQPEKMDLFLGFLKFQFLSLASNTNLITLGLSGSPHLQLFTSLSQNSNLEVGISINLPDCKWKGL